VGSAVAWGCSTKSRSRPKCVTSWLGSTDENCGCKAKARLLIEWGSPRIGWRGYFWINEAAARMTLFCFVCWKRVDSQMIIGVNWCMAVDRSFIWWKQLHNKRNITNCAEVGCFPVAWVIGGHHWHRLPMGGLETTSSKEGSQFSFGTIHSMPHSSNMTIRKISYEVYNSDWWK